MFTLKLSQSQMICFAMIDATGVEVPGLGAGLTILVSKAGGAFAPVAGAQAEISDGWYRYTATVAETNTVGPLAFAINGAGCLQQNLLYHVVSGVVGAIEFTYTLTDGVTLLPIEGAEIWITTDVAGLNVVWNGDTDAFGVARDDAGNLPWLDPGVYRFWRQRAGYTFAPEPDTETVS